MLLPCALPLMATAALAQAPTQSQSQGPSQAQGGTTLAPSSRVRDPSNDGGMNEVPPAATVEPDSTTNPPQRTSAPKGGLRAPSSQSFVTAATQSGLTEVELSKLALDRSSRTDVKQFAEALVRDHATVDAELKTVASGSGLRIPSALDMKHAALVRGIGAKSGKAFDDAYVRLMVADHARELALFRAESAVSQDALAQFAQKSLPTLEKHKRMAEQLGTTA